LIIYFLPRPKEEMKMTWTVIIVFGYNKGLIKGLPYNPNFLNPDKEGDENSKKVAHRTF